MGPPGHPGHKQVGGGPFPHVLIWFPACHPGREYESPAGRDLMCLVIKESQHLGRAWHTVGLQNICGVHLP